jgi:amidase
LIIDVQDAIIQTLEFLYEMELDLLTTNAVDLRRLLEAGKTTSVQIVETYLAQIERHEQAVHAFISIAPKNLLLKIASERDQERQQGQIKGPLHGIPIVVKVRGGQPSSTLREAE